MVRKPGQGGLENAPTLILHGHLDMVCAKNEGVEIDFLNEPIRLVIDGDFIRADGTSLGADNGIGVSYILALLDSKDLPHPPLEAVLTAMEEKGKVGAGQFDTSVLTGTRMIDFNWITDNEILAGCSGDVTFHVDIPGEYEPVPEPLSATRSLKVRGLLGGHCEFDIHLERANAILVLARALNAVLAKYDVRISGLVGGAQNSSIPADAEAVLSIRPGGRVRRRADRRRVGRHAARRVPAGRRWHPVGVGGGRRPARGVLRGRDRPVRPAHRADPERCAELEPADPRGGGDAPTTSAPCGPSTAACGWRPPSPRR